MKFNKNDKYFNIAIYAFFVIAASIVFYLVVSEVDGVFGQFKIVTAIMAPIIIGFGMAYLFNFLLVMYENRVLVNIKQKYKRFLGLVLTYITVGLAIYLFSKFILPQLVSSIVGLVNDIPGYVRVLSKKFTDLSENLQVSEELAVIINERFEAFTSYIVSFASDLVPKIGYFTRVIISRISNIILGLIISIYVLIDKEKFSGQSKKMLSAILPKNGADKTMELTRRANDIFGNFLSGKILDSMIVAVLTFVVFMLVKMPYAMLVSFIIGLTNIIPFFGPFIGAVPSFFIILFISPQKAILFIIIIIVIQQIDGNIIGPKILGDSLGISPFWILFSLLVFGKLLGFIGLVIGVPLFVLAYSIIKDLVESRLKKKGLPTKTEDYL